MKRTLPFHRLLIVFLGLSLLACTWVTSLFGPRPVIILAPDPSANATPASLEVAQTILTDRLIGLLGGEGVMVLDGKRLRVELANQSDVPDAIQLATEIGALAFFDQVVFIPPGLPIPEDVDVILTDADIARATPTEVENGDFQVAIELTAEGTQKMAAYTQANIGHFLVIARDGVVISSPMIQSQILDGSAVITGDFDFAAARALAIQLNSGRLPFKLVLVETD